MFGNETVTKVCEFQTKYRLSADGSAGMKTMAKLDEFLPAAGKPMPPLPPSGFTHKVRLHLRSIAMPAQTEMKQLSVMKEVYAQYAIMIEMASGESVRLRDDEA